MEKRISIDKSENRDGARSGFCAENVEGDQLRVQEKNITTSMQNELQENPSRKDGPNLLAKKYKKLEIQLAVEILGYLQTYLKNKGLEESTLHFNTIHELWQSKNPYKGFKSYHVGTLKRFLTSVCELREDASKKEFFNLSRTEVVGRIHILQGDDENTFDRDHVDYNYSNEKGERNIDMAESQGIQDKPAACGSSNTYVLESNATITSPTPLHSKSQEKQDTSAIVNLEERANGRRRFNQLIAVLFDCCLTRLRVIFKDIHPSWKNTEQDAKNMKKGKFKCFFKAQKIMFESGDIDRWDISLICNVLLHTEVSGGQMEQGKPLHRYKKGINKVLDVKGKIQSHISSLELTKKEFDAVNKDLRDASMSLGVHEDSFDAALKAGADLRQGEFYVAMLKEELNGCCNRLDQHDEQFSNMDGRVKRLEEQMLDLVINGSIKQNEIPKEAEKRDREEWDEWLNVKDFLKKVDTDKHQYMLIADRMSNVLMQNGNLNVLGRVRWKVVFDLDPDSDIDGLLKFCSPEKSSGGIVVPVSLANQSNISNVDAKRMHWVFANGKNQASDGEAPKQTFIEWKNAFKTPIQDIVRIFCENLDSRKSTFCIILPVTPGVSKNVANFIAKQIYERFSYAKYDMRFAAFEPEMNLEKVGGDCNAIHSCLSLKYILIGLHSLLGESQVSYKVPCRVKGMPVDIPIRQYQFISEYFDVLYSGCENIPKELSLEDKQEFENEHLRSFLCGNPITFESLCYGHDARRSLTTKIIRYITSMPQKFTSSQIVQINHAPGTGCTTIARRVLWDLKDEFPCMIVKELFAGENTLDLDLEPYVMKLWERINDLEKLCELSPVVLIDGSSNIVKLVSDQLVRRLAASGKRAIILRCVDYEGYCEIDHKLFHKESTFEVRSVLEDDPQDISAFRTAYLDYCSRFGVEQTIGNLKKDLQKRTRVFHFPMAVMLGESTKWKKNVMDSLELLKESFQSEYEVAILVAFIQLYARWPTPASLLEKYFEKKHQTYSEKANGYSEYLLNLMVSEKARNKNKFIGQKEINHRIHGIDDEENLEEDEDDSKCIEAYSFQHFAVAEHVLECSKRELDEITEDFVKSPLLRDYKTNKDLQRLIDDLFLYNKMNKKDPEPEVENTSYSHIDDFKFTLPITEHRFSLLMTKLTKSHNSKRIFEDVAKSINDITYFSHVARYYVYGAGKPNFQKATELLRTGLEVGKNGPVKKIRDLRNTEGYIKLREMRTSKEISSIDDLMSYADSALTLFHRAKDNPPRQFPNPLLGIVSVWLFCLERIIKLKNGNVEEALATVLQNTFFSVAIGESFELLDEVEIIVQDNPKLMDPDYTMQLCIDKKLGLMRIIGRKRVKRNRKLFHDIDVPTLCDEIFTKYFPGRKNKEILRLRAMWMIKQARSISRVKEKTKLFEILKQLVLTYEMYGYARKLLDISSIMDEPMLEMNECQEIVRNWQGKLQSDAFSYLYDYALSFVCVANGDISDNRARFERSKRICKEKTEWSPMRNKHYYYMAKCKKANQPGILISDQELSERYSKEVQNDHCSEPSGDESMEENIYSLGPRFWKNYASKILYECSGRVKLDSKSTRKGQGSSHIALEQGNLHINIPPHTLGVPYKDYRPDSRVKFFICFCLSGAKALEIRFVENTDQEGAKVGYGRQSSVKRDVRR